MKFSLRRFARRALASFPSLERMFVLREQYGRKMGRTLFGMEMLEAREMPAYIGGSLYDTAQAIAIDSSGNSYVTGTRSSNSTGNDAFVSAYNPAGSLLWTKTLGGSNSDAGQGIAVDSSGVYVVGWTASSEFPTTTGQITFGGGTIDSFVTKLSLQGSIVYSTFLGGTSDEWGYGIALDSQHNAFVTGATFGYFPTTTNASQTTFGGIEDDTADAYVVKLNSTGSRLWSTYLGGSDDDGGLGVALNASGDPYVTGYTASTNFPMAGTVPVNLSGSYNSFITHLDSLTGTPARSRYVGGSGVDSAYGVAISPAGDVFLTGYTNSPDLPVTKGLQGFGGDVDGFVTKLDSSLLNTAYLTYIGGSKADTANALAVDSKGNAYVTGFTAGAFPTTTNATQSTFGGGISDAFMVKLDASGKVTRSTYLGGSDADWGNGIAIDTSDTVHVAGFTQSSNWSTQGPGSSTYSGNGDGFLTNIPTIAISLQSSSTSTVYGSSVTFTATSPDATDVVFRDGAATLGHGTALGAGIWTFTSTLGAGTHTITADAISSSGNVATSAFVVLSVSKATLTVQVDPRVKIYGDPLPGFTSTITGFVNGDSTTVVSGAPSYSTPASSNSDPGEYAISAAQGTLTAPNYQFSFLPSILTIVPASTSITVDNPSSTIYGQTITFTATVRTSSTGTVFPTGLLVFFAGSEVGTATLVNGIATWSPNEPLPVGDNTVQVYYFGDGRFDSSTGQTLTTIVPAQVAIALTSATPSTSYGKSITYHATVTPIAPGSGLPTGEMIFFDGVEYELIELSNGVADWTTTEAIDAGVRPVFAFYQGDGNFVANSNSVDQTVTATASMVALQSPNDPVLYGDSSEIELSIGGTDAALGLPATGSVTVNDGIHQIVVQLVDGVARWVPDVLGVGDHTITVTYSGDINYTTGFLTFHRIVNAAPVSVTVYSSSDPIVYGEPIVYSAEVHSSVTGEAVAVGTVTFNDGEGGTIVAALDANGYASWTSTFSLAAPAGSITVSYSGSTSYLTGAGSIVQTVNKAVPTITITPVASSEFGVLPTFEAKVTSGTGVPTGTFVFNDGIETATVAVVGGIASWKGVLPIPAGTNRVYVRYSGDGNFQQVQTDLPFDVTMAASEVKLTSSGAALTYGNPVTFTAVVTDIAGQKATGTITFQDGVESVAVSLVDGKAVWTPSLAIPVGKASITANYSGDVNRSSSSGTVSVDISAATPMINLVQIRTSPSYGTPVEFKASLITPRLPGAKAPTGKIEFVDAQDPDQTVEIDLNGNYATALMKLPVGQHSITARYVGDSSYVSVTSAKIDLTVAKGQLAITADDLNWVLGTSGPNYTATYSLPNAKSDSELTGTLTFTTNPAIITTVGTYPITPSGLTSDSYDIIFKAGTLTVTAPVTAPTPANVTLNPPVGPFTAGQLLGIDGKVTSKSDGTPVTNGTVSIFVDGVSSGIATSLDANGSWSTVLVLNAGSHNFKAVYGNSESTSTPITVPAPTAAVNVGAVADTFVGVNGTALTTHTADDGRTWTAAKGTFAIVNNRAVLSTFDPVDRTAIATTRFNYSNARIDADIALGDASDVGAGIVFKFQNSTNYGLVRLSRDSSGDSVQFVEVTNGVINLWFSQSLPTNSGSQHLVLDLSGSILTVTVGSVNFSRTVTISGSSNSIGIWNFVPASSLVPSSFDNFVAVDSLPFTEVRLDTPLGIVASNQPVSFTATVTASRPPLGILEIYDNGVNAGSQTISSSNNSVTVPFSLLLTEGSHTLTARYSGISGTLNPFVSAPLTVQAGTVGTTKDSFNSFSPVDGRQADIGGIWTGVVGNFLSGNGTTRPAWIDAVNIAVTPYGAFVGNVRATVSVGSGSGGFGAGLVVRYTDASNYAFARFYRNDQAGGSLLEFWKVVNGAGTRVAWKSIATLTTASRSLSITFDHNQYHIEANSDTLDYTDPDNNLPGLGVGIYATSTTGVPPTISTFAARYVPKVEILGDANGLYVKVSSMDTTSIPSGTVQLTGVTGSATVTLDGSGIARITAPTVPGPFTITAKYSGNDVFASGGLQTYTSSNPVITVTSPGPLTVSEGNPFNGVVANVNSSSSKVDVTIDWGDGSALTQLTGVAPGAINAGHTYRTAKNNSATPDYTINVTATSGSDTASVNLPIEVSDANWGFNAASSLTNDSPTYTSAPSIDTGVFFNKILGAFSDANPAWQSSDYKLSVDWGDGSLPISLTVDSKGDIKETVSGLPQTPSHTYRNSGVYQATVTVSDLVTGAVKSSTTPITIDRRPYAIKDTFTAIAGTTTSFQLRAIDPDGDAVTFDSFTDPLLGDLTLDSKTGLITYSLAATASGTDEFYFTASDGTKSSNLGLIRILIAPSVTSPNGSTQASPIDSTNPRVFLLDRDVSTVVGKSIKLTAIDGIEQGNITSIEWDYDYDGTNFTVDSSGSLTANPSYGVTGVYHVAVRVTNDAGATDINDGYVWVFDSDTNLQPFSPVITSSADQISVGGTVNFSLVGVSLSDSVSWDLHFSGSSFQSESSDSTTSRTFESPGVYLVAADVVNAFGDEKVVLKTVVVTAPTPVPVTPPPPVSPPVYPVTTITASATTIDVGDSVYFTLNVVGDSSATADWYFDHDGALGWDDYGSKVWHGFASPGIYHIALTVYTTDSQYNYTWDQTITVVDKEKYVLIADSVYGTNADATTFTKPLIYDASGFPTDTASLEWDFDYDGKQFDVDSTDTTPTPTLKSGDRYGAVRVGGTTRTSVATFRISIEEVNPSVTINATTPVVLGSPAQFTATATNPQNLSSAQIQYEWDFDYGDLDSFEAIALDDVRVTGADTLTPSFRYDSPGEYSAALRVTYGGQVLDPVVVTIKVVPEGSVTLSATAPDNTPVTPTEGQDVWFKVNGVPDADFDYYGTFINRTSLYADWNNDGDYVAIPESDWKYSSPNPDTGLLSFWFKHTFSDNGTYNVNFSVEDLYGGEVVSNVSVNVANSPPTATGNFVDPQNSAQLVAGDGSITPKYIPGQTVRYTFTNVSDASPSDAEVGFKYHFVLDSGAETVSDIPSMNLGSKFATGSKHSLRAWVTDIDNGASAFVNSTFQILSDIVFANESSSDKGGSVVVNYVNPDNTNGSMTIAPGSTYRFEQEITKANVVISTAGTYAISSNFAIDAIDANVSNVNLTLRTDRIDPFKLMGVTDATGTLVGVPTLVGDGHVGQITIGANSVITLYSRGTFAGLQAGPNSYAEQLRFTTNFFPDAPNKGAIVADHAGSIIATGAIHGLLLQDGVSVLSASRFIGNENGDGSALQFETWLDRSREIWPTFITHGPNGFQGNGVNFEHAQHDTVRMTIDPANGKILAVRGPNGLISGYTVSTTDGLPTSISDSTGVFTFGRAPDGRPIRTSFVATPTPPPVSVEPPTSTWGFFGSVVSTAWSGVVEGATTVYNAGVQVVQTATQTIVAGAKAIAAYAYETWSYAGQSITWAIEQGKQAALYVGDLAITATKELAQGFMKKVAEWGGPILDLLNKVKELATLAGSTAAQVLSDFVSDPLGLMGKVFDGVYKGFTNFFANILETGKNAFLQWLFGPLDGLSGLLDQAPKNWADWQDVGRWLITDVFQLNWDSIRGLIISKIGAGNVDMITNAIDQLDKILGGDEPSVDKVVDYLKNKVNIDFTKLATDAITEVGKQISLQLIPPLLDKLTGILSGGATTALSSIYSGITWLMDNMNKLSNSTEIMIRVAQRIHDVYVGGNVEAIVRGADGKDQKVVMAASDALANDVKSLLDSLIPHILTFTVSQFKLGGIPNAIRSVVDKIRNKPLELLGTALQAVVDKAKKAVGLNRKSNELNAITLELDAGSIKYNVKMWVENRDGKAVIMRSANGQNEAPLDFTKDLPAGTSPTQEMINAKKAAEDDAAAILKLQKEIDNKKSSAPKDHPYIPNAADTKALLDAMKKLAADLKVEFDKLIDAKATCFFSLACFTAGTPIRTPDGWLTIEALKVGDKVLSRDEFNANGEVVAKIVEEVFVRFAEVRKIKVNGKQIGTTAEHPFYAWERGWVPARELQVGDTLLCEDGVWRAVEEVGETDEWQTVYNVRVADYHTYFVGEDASAVWAHNAYIFRGDVNHIPKSGPIGSALDTSLTNVDLAQALYDHVKQNLGHSSSPVTSWSESQGIAKNKFAAGRPDKVTKVNLDDLQVLANSGDVILYYPADVQRLLKDSGIKKLIKDANNIFRQMQANDEILVRGIIPASIQQLIK